MSDKDRFQTLRSRAESALSSPNHRRFLPAPVLPVGTESAPDPLRLMHDLQVHQVELEMQNDELRRTQTALEGAHKRYFDLFDLAPVGYLTLGDNRRIVEVNQTALRMFGLPLSQMVGQELTHFICYDDQDIFYLFTKRLLWVSMPQVCELRLRRKSGELFWASITCARATSGVLQHVVVQDVSALKKAAEEQRLAAATFESIAGMFVTDPQGVFLRVNRAFTAITGFAMGELVGKTPRFLNSGRHDEAFYADVWATVAELGVWQGEVWNRRKCGEVYPEWLSVTAVKNSSGETTHFVGTFTDITARKVAETEIQALAFSDLLTGLPNRRALLEKLGIALALGADNRQLGALLLVNLDNFKALNDTMGHDNGDRLLQQVAQSLQVCEQPGSSVARLGGDEFVVMLEGLGSDATHATTAALGVSATLLSALNHTYQLGGHGQHSSVSIGVTLFGDRAEPITEPLKRADLAMSDAKAVGRGTARLFDPLAHAKVQKRAQLEADLRDALAHHQFEMHYQPQVDANGHTTSAEALVRWMHPTRGMVLPTDFISLTEETGLILPLGHWILDAVCDQLAAWANQPPMAGIKVAVNVSARQLLQSDFVELVTAALQRSGANPRRLKLELTESMLAVNVEDVIAKMVALKAIGVGFSLDDFGTGYSSLSYLKRLPIEQLKIDQGFVKDILTDGNGAAIAKMVIALARTLGLDVIAEGVETPEQQAFLADCGCLAYQGHLFSHPVTVELFEALVVAGCA